MPKLGDTFLAGNDEEEDYHLHIVITSPDADGNVLLVSVTTLRKWSDKTVVLRVGEHPFIKHDSCIAYQYAIIKDGNELDEALNARPGLRREPLTPAILNRVQRGLLESDFTENGIRHYFRDIYPNPDDLR